MCVKQKRRRETAWASQQRERERWGELIVAEMDNGRDGETTSTIVKLVNEVNFIEYTQKECF